MIIAIVLHAFHIFIMIRRFILHDHEDNIVIVIIYAVSAFLRLGMEAYILYITVNYYLFVLKRRVAFYHSLHMTVPCKSIVMFSWVGFILILIFLEVSSIFAISVFIPQSKD